MSRYKILVVTEQENFRLEIKNRLSRMDNIALVGFAALDKDLETKIKGYAPHAVLLVQDQQEDNLFDTAQHIYQGFPGCAVVLMVKDLSIDVIKTAMQAGVREVINQDNLDELEASLLKAAQLEQSRAVGIRSDPRVIAFFSGRGGSGKTTIAVNSAIALAGSGQRTVLIDLNLSFGDSAILLNIKAKDTIAELVQEKSTFGIDEIRSFCMQHASGVSILCAPSSPEHGEYVNSRHVELLINQMRPYYDFIVLDLPCNINETTITALESADNIVMVTRKDLSGLKTTKQMLDIFRTLQQSEKVQLLLNADHKSILSLKDMERVLETPFSFVIPDDQKTAQICQERGVPFVTDLPRTRLSKDVQKMTRSWIDQNSRRDDA